MTATFYVGDAIQVMNQLPEKSVDLVLSSPPFLALRSYLPADHPDKSLEGGSQATPGEFIDWLIDVVEACDRVLAPHGSLCFELGDTYAGSSGAGGDYLNAGLREGQPGFDGPAVRNRALARAETYEGGASDRHDFAKPGTNSRLASGVGWPLAKSLSLIPELFRFTLVYGFNPLTGRQTERWRLRNVIRWVRPNPPVGALGDKFRPATSELMVFCKSAKRFFDLDTVREPASPNTHRRNAAGVDKRPNTTPSGQRDGNWSTLAIEDNPNPAGAPPLDWWNIPLLEGEEPTVYGPKEKPHRMSSGGGSAIRAGVPRGAKGDLQSNPNGAPPLDWWNIPPGGYPGAHYAVWPPELLVKPIKAMCPSKVCRVCGEPSRRIVETNYEATDNRLANQLAPNGGRSEYGRGGQPTPTSNRLRSAPLTLGFTDCGHDDYRPGLVLDPFVGSGTTLSVATGHGRDAIGIDLDERNYELALDRVGPMFLTRGEVGV